MILIQHCRCTRDRIRPAVVEVDGCVVLAWSLAMRKNNGDIFICSRVEERPRRRLPERDEDGWRRRVCPQHAGKVAREEGLAEVPQRTDGEGTAPVVGTLAACCVSNFCWPLVCLA